MLKNKGYHTKYYAFKCIHTTLVYRVHTPYRYKQTIKNSLNHLRKQSGQKRKQNLGCQRVIKWSCHQILTFGL